MGMPQRSEQVVRRSESKDKSTTSPGLISAEVFKGVVLRERKRADRSKQPFVLVLVSANDAASKVWGPAVEALTAAKRETDILGWFTHNSTLGIVLTEVQSFDSRIGREIEARIRIEFAKRMEPSMLDGLAFSSTSIRNWPPRKAFCRRRTP